MSAPAGTASSRLRAAVSTPGFWLRGLLGYLTSVPVAVVLAGSLAAVVDQGFPPPAGLILGVLMQGTGPAWLVFALPAAFCRIAAASAGTFTRSRAAGTGAATGLIGLALMPLIGGAGAPFNPVILAVTVAAGAVAGLVWRAVERLVTA